MTCTLLVSVGWFRIQCTVVFPSSCYYIYTNMQPTPHIYEYYVSAHSIYCSNIMCIHVAYSIHTCTAHTHTHIYIYHTPANHTHSNIIYTCHAHPKHIQTIMCTLHIHTRTYTLKHTQTHYLTLFMHMCTYIHTYPHTAPADLIRLILPNTLRPRHVPQVLSHHPLRDPVKQCPLCPHATI